MFSIERTQLMIKTKYFLTLGTVFFSFLIMQSVPVKIVMQTPESEVQEKSLVDTKLQFYYGMFRDMHTNARKEGKFSEPRLVTDTITVSMQDSSWLGSKEPKEVMLCIAALVTVMRADQIPSLTTQKNPENLVVVRNIKDFEDTVDSWRTRPEKPKITECIMDDGSGIVLHAKLVRAVRRDLGKIQELHNLNEQKHATHDSRNTSPSLSHSGTAS
jgi:hypothetical protein